MSIVLNMVGGGGSLRDTDAVLLVTVPTGSSATATKGAVTLTPTIWTTSSDNTLDCALFSIPASTFDSNAWTVTATLNSQTASGTIVIDSAKEYEMTISYTLYVFHNGQIGSEFGSILTASRATGTHSATISNNLLVLKNTYTSGASQKSIIFYMQNMVDVSNFSSLLMKLSVPSGSFSGNDQPRFGVLTNLDYAWVPNISWLAVKNITSAVSSLTLFSLDISSVSGNVYVAIAFGNGSSINTTTVNISDWYLET